MIKLFQLTGLFLILALTTRAQIYEIDNINGQTVSTCSGYFYDSGGPAGNYASNASYTVTFCPSTPNTYIQLVFTQWNLATGSSLQVFDGPDNTYNSFGTFSAGGFNPMLMDVIATPTNTSGCLTITFTAGSATNQGWEALVQCAIPCQTILASLFSSTPTISGGFIDICQGGTITLAGGGLFPQNNLVYGQSNFNSTFIWNFGDGIIDTTTSVTSHTYTTVGGYNINLTVIDSMGCKSTNTLDARVRISTSPVFAGTMPEDSVICDGEEVVLIGEVETTPFEVTADLALAGQTFLPDGSGASYSTSLIFDAFAPGQTLTNVNDIISICAVMEHSYLGDLDIWLECPNGSIVTFVDYPNGCGSTYLGIPIDIDSDLTPGTGFEYCWSPSATLGTFSAMCGGSGGTLPAGTYSSLTPWTNFIGCPLNGTWTIGITDNLLSDNGYIFEWGLTFNPNILPSNFNYEPSIVDYEWTNTFGVLVDSNWTDATLAPPVGQYNYTFTVVDDFGCDYDTVVHLNVLPSYEVNFPNDTILCSDATLFLDATDNGENAGAIYNWHWDFMDPQIISTAGTYTVTKPGMYYVTIPNIIAECGHTDTIHVQYNELELDLGNDITGVCNTNLVVLDATTPTAGYQGGVQYQWNTLAITPTITAWSSGTYTVSVTRGNCTEIDVIHVQYDSPVQVNLPTEAFLCVGSSLEINPGWPGQSYLWNNGSSANIITVTNPGTYTVTITNACGSSSDNIQVINYTIPVVELGPDLATCQGIPVVINGQYTGVGPTPTYLWSNGSTNPVVSAVNQGYYSVTTTNPCGSYSDQVYLAVDLPLQINLGNDTTICQGQSLSLSVNQTGNFTYWSTGSTANSISVSTPDLYSVEVENLCGTFGDEILVGVSVFDFNLGPDASFCPGTTYFINPNIPGAVSYFWSNGSQQSSILVTDPGTYTLTATNVYNCTDNDEITVTTYNTDLDLGADTTICEGSVYLLSSGISGFPHQWSTGAQTTEIQVTTPGTYSLTINHLCGVLSDEVNINLAPSPVVDLGPDTIQISAGTTITLDAGTSGSSYQWSNGSTNQTVTVGQGTYTVTVSLGDCIATDKIIIVEKLSIESPDHLRNVLVYPNPANESLNISSEEIVISRCQLYNPIGQLVIQEEVNNHSIHLNLKSIAEGLYFLRVEAANGQYLIQQVVISR